jgi:hypothetical protein
MHQNIKINNVKSLDAKLYGAKYYDFMLYKGNTYNSVDKLKDMSIIDMSNLDIVDGKLYSNTVWSGATNNGVVMNDIGLTGMDNGLINFRKDRVTNAEFVELLTGSTYSIDTDDKRFFLTPITGNTQMYDYPMYLYNGEDGKYVACKGGFYQGFFKLFGYDYEVVPSKMDSDWTLHFDLRPRTDYEVTDTLVNYTHTNNNGIFFFIGTRAENKFWPFYKTDSEIMDNMKKIDAQSEGYFAGCGEDGETYNINENNIISLENKWLMDEIEEDLGHVHSDYFADGDGYFACDYMTNASNTKEYMHTNDVKCACEDYFSDGYFSEQCTNNKNYVSDEYIGSGLTINENGYDDSAGHPMTSYGYDEIVSDNKFLLFDRTSTGFTIDTWVEGSKVVIENRKNWASPNYFLLMNRTETGYTKETIDEYNETKDAHRYNYNIHNDIANNVFALRIKEDGSIGYRYGVYDCENENRYKVLEEYSKPNMVKPNEWNDIAVKFSIIRPSESHCDKSEKRMKIYFYVNGYLIFVSKEVSAFNFKHIEKECYEKQETVPYNISLGGGSLGLLETILPNYYAISDYILPIERDFCGTFMGDIKSFKMYGGKMDYSTIINYLS